MIDVRIPYEPQKHLGQAIRKAMGTVSDWVLFLDSDVLPVTPVWYDVSLETINRVGHDAGWITCYTNKIGNPLQKAPGRPVGQDMDEHFEYAKKLYTENRDIITEHTSSQFKFSGFFCLTHKKAFNDVINNFDIKDNHFIGWDNWFYDRLRECGYKTYLMNSVYFYHSYRRLWKDDFWKDKFK